MPNLIFTHSIIWNLLETFSRSHERNDIKLFVKLECGSIDNNIISAMKDKVTQVSGDSDRDVVLKKEVGLPSAIAISIGNVIGSGIFVMPRGAARGGGSVGATLLMWTLGGLFSATGALAFAELCTLLPKSGGQYQYLKAAVGKWLGFMFGWGNLVLTNGASLAIMALTFADYILAILYNDGCGKPPRIISKLVAILLLGVLAVINCYSVKHVARMHVAASLAKCCALVMISVGGIVRLFQGHTQAFTGAFQDTNTDLSSVVLGVYSCMFAYGGWFSTTMVAEEVRNPSRSIPITMGVVVLTVTCLYVFTNISYFTVMTVDELLASPAVGVTWAESVMPGYSWIIPLCVTISVFGSLNIGIMAGSRVHFALARDGVWPGLLGMINVKRQTPIPSVIATAGCAAFYVIIGDVSGLTVFLSFVDWLWHFLVMVALFVLRRKMKHSPRPYRVPTIFPILFGLFSGALVVVPIVGNPRIEFLYASLMTVAGVIVYLLFVRFKRTIPGVSYLECGLQLLFQACPYLLTDTEPNVDKI